MKRGPLLPSSLIVAPALLAKKVFLGRGGLCYLLAYCCSCCFGKKSLFCEEGPFVAPSLMKRGPLLPSSLIVAPALLAKKVFSVKRGPLLPLRL